VGDHERTIRVEIFDRVYHVQSSTDEKYTRRLAQSVDATMRLIAAQTQTVESLRIAVLAALHYADRYEQLQERYQKLNGAVSEKSAKIRQALDAAGEVNPIG